MCGQSASAQSGGNSLIAWNPVKSFQDTLFDLQTFYGVRDRLLNTTPQGQNLINLYDQYGLQIGDLLFANPQMKDDAVALLQHWQTKLQALLDGQGNTVVITQDEVDAINHFLDELQSVARDDLRTSLQSERAEFNLPSMVGDSISQAWEKVKQLPVPTKTPTPTATTTPTPNPGDTTPPTLSAYLFTSPRWNPKGFIKVYLVGAAFDSQSGIQSIQMTVQDEYGQSQPKIPTIYPKSNRPFFWEETILLQNYSRPDDKDGRTFTIIVIVTDNAGNQATKKLTYVVWRK